MYRFTIVPVPLHLFVEIHVDTQTTVCCHTTGCSRIYIYIYWEDSQCACKQFGTCVQCANICKYVLLDIACRLLIKPRVRLHRQSLDGSGSACESSGLGYSNLRARAKRSRSTLGSGFRPATHVPIRLVGLKSVAIPDSKLIKHDKTIKRGKK